MTRIDMTTREWHELIKPVLPHVLKDGDFPELHQVRIEARERAVIAVATDRYTIGAERHALAEPLAGRAVIALDADDLKATLKLFTYSKDEDPPLRVIIDRASVPIAIAGTPASVDCLAITLEDESGVRVVLRDATSASRSPLANWRTMLREAIRRPLAPVAPALSLHAGQLARWGAAVRAGERLAIYAGDTGTAPFLVLVEDHFAGLWVPVQYLDGPDKMLAESPWGYELHEIEDGGFDLRTASGVNTGRRLTEAVADQARAAGMEVTGEPGSRTIHVPEGGWPDGNDSDPLTGDLQQPALD